MKNTILGKIEKLIVLFLLSFCFVNLPVIAQNKQKKKNIANSACKIGSIGFTCPADFTREQTIDETTILFKKTYNGSITYFFVSVPNGDFDDNKVKEVIGTEFSEKKEGKFLWKNLEEPFVMDLDTKYEKKIIGSLGYDKIKLINFVSRYFEFNKKLIVMGYAYDTEKEGIAGKQAFEKGNAIGDNANGCNAIATTINSITKEKKGNLQYCLLTGIGSN